MKGIDIASMQGVPDFTKLKTLGYEVVYIKATEGLTYNNPYMKRQYDGAKAQGLKIGFYHYLRANNPIAEAEHFIAVTKGYSADCLYGIDVEVTLKQNGTQISSNVRKFADTLINKNMPVCIYTGDAFYSAYLNVSVKNIPVWIAHYGVSQPDYKGYVGFQYSESGRLNGCVGDVDLDVFTDAILIRGNSLSVASKQFIISMLGNIQNKGFIAVGGVNSCKIGTEGQSLRLEAFSMTIDGIDFTCSAHEQDIGDTATVGEGSVLGTINMAKRLEGITITVTSIPIGYKLQYRANIQNLGLTAWAGSGTYCGTKGKALRLEEIEVQIIKA